MDGMEGNIRSKDKEIERRGERRERGQERLGKAEDGQRLEKREGAGKGNEIERGMYLKKERAVC